MPEISRFFGIVIKMFFDDHNPPNFHAERKKRAPADAGRCRDYKPCPSLERWKRVV